jgi:hypothetical protein
MENLNLKLGEEWLDVPGNAVLKYRMTSNIFFDGEKQRERSLQLNLPYTARNNRLLGRLADTPTATNAQTLWLNVEVFSGQTYVFEGTLKVKETARGYAVHILGQMGTLHEMVGDDNLRDIEWSTGLTGSVTRQQIAEGSYPTYPVWYPAMLMFQAAPQDTLASVNEGLFSSVKGRYMAPPAPFPNSNPNATNAAFYLLYVLDTICKYYGIGKLGGIWRTSELADLLLHSADIRDFDWEKQAFTPESVPDMKVLDFLGMLETMFCCEFRLDNDLQLTCTFMRDTAVRTDMVEWTDRLSGPVTRFWTDNTEGLHLKWPDKLADMYNPADTSVMASPQKFDTNADTLVIYVAQDVAYSGVSAYVRCENHWFRFQTYNGELKWVNEDWNMQIQQPDPAQLLPEVANLAALPTITPALFGKVALVRNEGWYYMAQGVAGFPFSYKWDKAFWNATELKLGQRYRTIEPQGFPVPMDKLGPDYEGDPFGYEFKMRLPGFKGVKCRTDATEKVTAQVPSDLMPVLSFKREIVTVSQTNWPGGVPTVITFPYCYASSDEFDADLNDAYDLSLWWDGPKGLYNLWWKDWAQVLIGSQEIEMMLNLTLTDIIALDMHRPVYIDGMKMWLRTVDVSFPLTGPVKVRAVRV